MLVKEFMLVSNLFDGWDSVDFLLDVSDGSDVLNNEWDFVLEDVFLNFPEGEFFNIGDLIRNKGLSRVALEELSNIWFFDGDLIRNFLPGGLLEYVFDGVWLLIILGNCDLARDDVWNFFQNTVVDSLGGFIWNSDFLFIWNLVVDSIRNLLRNDVWNSVGNSVWDLSSGSIRDFNLDFVWNLSLDSVRNLFLDFNWLEGLDFILLSDVLSLSNLVWDLLNSHYWNLLSNLVFLSDIISNSVDVSVIGRISGGEFRIITNLGPSVNP